MNNKELQYLISSFWHSNMYLWIFASTCIWLYVIEVAPPYLIYLDWIHLICFIPSLIAWYHCAPPGRTLEGHKDHLVLLIYYEYITTNVVHV